MLTALLPLLLSGLSIPEVHHAIYSGFNLEWVKPLGQNGQVALSVGSAAIDGIPAYPAPPGMPAGSFFPNDSPPLIRPNVGAGIVLAVGQTYVAYCYIFGDLTGLGRGSTWWEDPTNMDFTCWVGSAYRPTPDGHPTNPILYSGRGQALLVSSALFVGSVVYLDVAANVFYQGNPGGLSALPFFRNGSQVIYATNNPCANLACTQNGWDFGIPTTAVGAPLPVNPILTHAYSAVSPVIFPGDFTLDQAANPLPLSASAIILDSEGYSHESAGTLCFLDPNQPSFGVNQSRSCQSEVQLDNDNGGPYRPLAPLRTHVNIGQSTTAGNGYGEIWVGAFSSPSPAGMSYFDLAYRGYVEPERQLVSQLPVP